MILNILSHNNYKDSCKYCDGVVPNCHCEFFKRLNKANLPFTDTINNKLLEIEECNGDGNGPITSKWLTALKKIKSSFRHKWHNNFGNKAIPPNNSSDQYQSEAQLTVRSLCPTIRSVPLENFSTRIYNNLIIFLILTNGLCKETSKNIFERLLGIYCPNSLRNTKFIDYDGTTYKKLQKSLAREKMLTQEEQKKRKLIYNPCNKHVFWALRPINFDREYSYLMFCNKALERQGPWKNYHSGVRKFPRRHLIRRWLNRKWEWETIIDYIFSELSTEQNEIRTVTRKPQLRCMGEKMKKVNTKSFSQAIDMEENVTLGNTLSTNAEILQDAFEKLVYICNTDIQPQIKPPNNVTVRTI